MNILIISSSFFQNLIQIQEPKISINGSLQSDSKSSYSFEDGISEVKIEFDFPLNKTSSMFGGCSKITEINLSNFDASQVTSMNNMFYQCLSLISLDFSNIDTSRVTDMSYMFSICTVLKSIDLSHFVTSKVKNMNSMFLKSGTLEFLNFMNFDTSSVTTMNNMFDECTSLKSLNLSAFNTLQVATLSRMFYGSNNLEYINFKIAKINSFENINEAFASTPKNLIISCECDNDILMSLFQEKKFIYCNNKDSIHQIKYICYMKNSTLYNKYVCDICGQNFYQNYHIINEVDEPYIDCFEIIDEYYLNINSWSYEPCYDTCKTCEISGDESQHNCITCKDNFNGRINADLNYINCDKLDFLDTYKLEDIIINESDETIQDIIFDLINEFNIDDLDNGRDKIIIDNKKRTIKLTSTSNQKNNEKENEITMDLGQCETILKRECHIPDDDPLYILQIISEEEGMKIPKLEYEVYYPLYDNYLKKLNIALCKDTKVEISIPVKINGTLDKYNPKSDYYNEMFKNNFRFWNRYIIKR